MPDHLITKFVGTEDTVAFTWVDGEQVNCTIRAKVGRVENGLYHHKNIPDEWPLENGVLRSPEYYINELKAYGSHLNMVEMCFSRSGETLKDVDNKVMPSFVEQVSSGLEGITVIGYSRGRVNALPDTLARELSDEGRAYGDRVMGLGTFETTGRTSISRFQNGQRLHGHSLEAQQFQPYHVRAAEARARSARAGSARAGTSSMPGGAPQASGARVGGLDAGAEHVGEEALDKWFQDLGIFS